ncbi:Crp/Fnr family transcriptional regulator [Tissierella carlieri]|uniref:Crp/Fnr family transcriptional regulator n=1 Tax=Tissierella carlieri TaxID=689904 RepID=A0ABT1SG38_9FIRM|nr:Crp/Fnr family transcriptional regulator [Tissierella carlieri]MCQ4925458.1 Crp/Fnr family transcriptional regulator [Tissierella carlieri]
MDCNCFKREGKNCIEIVPIFSNLTYEEMMEVARITKEKTFEKGEMIYMAGDKGDKLYVIHSGKVKITRFTDSGKEQVIRVLGPGDFMGELSIFSPLPLTDNGEALSQTVTCMIDGKKLKELMKKYPTIAFKVMEELSQRLEKAEHLIENISLHGVERRLALTLINMANEKGEVSLKMSKRDFASHLGMSQETLSRKLTVFQDMGIIKLIGHRRIILLDIEALEKIE